MKNIFTALTIASFFFFSSCSEDIQEPGVPMVTYSISCTDCDVSYTDENGARQIAYNQNSSWTYTFEGVPGQDLYVGAFNHAAEQQIGSYISVNGSVVGSVEEVKSTNDMVFIRTTL